MATASSKSKQFSLRTVSSSGQPASSSTWIAFRTAAYFPRAKKYCIWLTKRGQKREANRHVIELEDFRVALIYNTVNETIESFVGVNGERGSCRVTSMSTELCHGERWRRGRMGWVGQPAFWLPSHNTSQSRTFVSFSCIVRLRDWAFIAW